jgi:hypothetical protein
MSHTPMIGTSPRPDPPEDPPSSAVDGPRPLSRREALPLMGLAVLAVGACELDLDPMAVTDDAAPDDWLARARVHRGGFQRFALLRKTDGVAVRVDADGTGTLTVTVNQTDPSTGRLVRVGDGPRVLERYEGVTNETITAIESEHFVFYYLPET